MNHQLPSPHERLYELLEVLRPDFDKHEEAAQEGGWSDGDISLNAEQARRLKRGDDLDEAREELAELLEKHPNLIDARLIDTWYEIARADDLLGEAVQDVAVPEHLQQQILAAIDSHKSVVQAKASSYKWFANRFNAVAAGLAVVASIVTMVAWWMLADPFGGLQKDQVLAAASKCFADGPSPSAESLSGPQSPETKGILKNFAPGEDVLSPDAATWERVDYKIFDSPAIVYRFKDEHGNEAALFVIREPRAVKGLINRPPQRPQLMTAGRSIGAWQSDGLVYVLVSSGNEDAWRSLLVPQRPVT